MQAATEALEQERRKDQLERKLENRPDKQDLVDHNIMKGKLFCGEYSMELNLLLMRTNNRCCVRTIRHSRCFVWRVLHSFFQTQQNVNLLVVSYLREMMIDLMEAMMIDENT